MIAMVLCAGEGTRLRPLTTVLPKPLVPVGNRPVIEYTLLNLKRHGIQDVVLNLGYRGESIQSYLGDGSRIGIRIHYSFEKKLLGTAGGVKKVEKLFLEDPDPDFLVASGDSLTDLPLTPMIQFHKKKRAYATIAVAKVENRFEYGVILHNSKSQITEFVEKPSWEDVFSDRVNTGIYVFKKEILKKIPKGKFYDFGKQLLPQLISSQKVYAYPFKEFWTDIGTLPEYMRAQHVILNKGIELKSHLREWKPSIWLGKNCQIESGVQFRKPCMVGNHCILDKNAIIGPNSIIGNRSTIGSGSVLQGSVLWEGVQIGSDVVLNQTIVCSKERIPDKISIHNGIILGGRHE